MKHWSCTLNVFEVMHHLMKLLPETLACYTNNMPLHPVSRVVLDPSSAPFLVPVAPLFFRRHPRVCHTMDWDKSYMCAYIFTGVWSAFPAIFGWCVHDIAGSASRAAQQPNADRFVRSLLPSVIYIFWGPIESPFHIKSPFWVSSFTPCNFSCFKSLVAITLNPTILRSRFVKSKSLKNEGSSQSWRTPSWIYVLPVSFHRSLAGSSSWRTLDCRNIPCLWHAAFDYAVFSLRLLDRIQLIKAFFRRSAHIQLANRHRKADICSPIVSKYTNRFVLLLA